MISKLPQEFLKNMKEILKDEYEDYLNSFHQEEIHSLRINTSKINIKDFLKSVPFKLEAIKWSDDGFYYDINDNITKHPYYHAGLYYLQEASAMFPASILPIEENDHVLDLCAAPGGKSLKILNKLNHTGLLISNDISPSRASILLQNIIKQGYYRYYVTSLDIKDFQDVFFDAILVDAPCSGEGMFRKDHALIKSWLNKGPDYYPTIQKELILKASHILKPGGYMVYSTCTFEIKENEDVIRYLLNNNHEMKLIYIYDYEGFDRGIDLKECIRIYPHKVKGEGHFIALLKKDGEKIKNSILKDITYPTEINNIKHSFNNGYFINRDQKLFFIPNHNIDFKNKRVLRSGLLIGNRNNKSFTFDHSFSRILKANEYPLICNLELNDNRILKYLKGETINIKDYHLPNDLILICVNNYPLGFGINNNGLLKNKLPKNILIK